MNGASTCFPQMPARPKNKPPVHWEASRFIEAVTKKAESCLVRRGRTRPLGSLNFGRNLQLVLPLACMDVSASALRRGLTKFLTRQAAGLRVSSMATIIFPSTTFTG